MDQKLITSILIGALALWVLYRRVRRNIGRQPLNARRMGGRIVLLAVIAVLMASGATRDVELLGALLAGIAGGAALGWLGLRHTKFEATVEGKFYIPHTYIGVLVSALLLSRIAYRLPGRFIQPRTRQHRRTEIRLRRTRKVHSRSRFSGW